MAEITIIGENRVDPVGPPELASGHSIEWTNETDQLSTIVFREPSPFEDGRITFQIEPKRTVRSAAIKAEPGVFCYKVVLWKATAEEHAGNLSSSRREKGITRSFSGGSGGLFEPTIIVRKPS